MQRSSRFRVWGLLFRCCLLLVCGGCCARGRRVAAGGRNGCVLRVGRDGVIGHRASSESETISKFGCKFAAVCGERGFLFFPFFSLSLSCRPDFADQRAFPLTADGRSAGVVLFRYLISPRGLDSGTVAMYVFMSLLSKRNSSNRLFHAISVCLLWRRICAAPPKGTRAKAEGKPTTVPKAFSFSCSSRQSERPSAYPSVLMPFSFELLFPTSFFLPSSLFILDFHNYPPVALPLSWPPRPPTQPSGTSIP